MVKAKKKAGRKAGDKLPKTIAGVKVPKELRGPAARARRLVEDHPVISEAVAAGLLAAAAALMDAKGDKKTKAVMKAAAVAAGSRLMAEARDVGKAAVGRKLGVAAGTGTKSGRTKRSPAK